MLCASREKVSISKPEDKSKTKEQGNIEPLSHFAEYDLQITGTPAGCINLPSSQFNQLTNHLRSNCKFSKLKRNLQSVVAGGLVR
jgi:hypothetical protein